MTSWRGPAGVLTQQHLRVTKTARKCAPLNNRTISKKLKSPRDQHKNITEHFSRRSLAANSSTFRTVRGHLKSSHIADKRKNFHMALYPLPSSSNESVIDNGRSVWQMSRFTSKIVFDHSQRRSPNARYRSKVPASNKILVLRLNLLIRCRLSHACKDASLEVQHSLRDNVEQSKKNTCTISTLFSLFSAC